MKRHSRKTTTGLHYLFFFLKNADFVLNSSIFSQHFWKIPLYTQHHCGTYFSAFLEMDYKRWASNERKSVFLLISDKSVKEKRQLCFGHWWSVFSPLFFVENKRPAWQEPECEVMRMDLKTKTKLHVSFPAKIRESRIHEISRRLGTLDID